jgi:predicted nucleotidyltransferase
MYLNKYTNEIKLLCQQNKVKSLYVFGSVLGNRFSDKSDIDFIVDIDISDPLEYADCYFSLKFAMEDLFKRPVDLLEQRALKNPYLIESINKSKTLLYAS